MSNTINTQAGSQSLSNQTASANAGVDSDDIGSWYQAMAEAWGKALDNQAVEITNLSEQVNSGADNPSSITMLTAASLKMQFLSNNASTATTSIGQALESLARK